MKQLPFFLAMLLIVALGVALRGPNLAQRPLHNDEGVNTVKFNELWTSGRFDYDPNEYHGPTLYYFTLPVVWITGEKDYERTNELTYRIVPLIFGIGLILLLPLVSDGLGRGGVLWAALFTAVSPAFVYYSRYYIHEVPLVFFTFGAIACGWRYRRSNRLIWAAGCGAFIGLTYATKETWVLALAAAAASAVTAATIWRAMLKGAPHQLHFRKRAIAVGAAAFLVVFVLFYSNFFRSGRGLIDAVMTYVHYARRASGNEHNEPWNYYLSMLLWYRVKPGPVWTQGAIVILAIVGFLLAVFRRHTIHRAATAVHQPADAVHHQRELARDSTPSAAPLPAFPAFPPFVRFIAFYTLFLTIAFSVIRYKTPWCMLGFLHGMILLAGFACAQLVRITPRVIGKTLVTLALLAAAGHLAWEADRATNDFADPKHPHYFEVSRYNPYVYAHTGRDIFAMVKRMNELAALSPEGMRLPVNVISPEYWPLPFYLRHFKNVSYPRGPSEYRPAELIIGSAEDADRLTGDDAKVKYVASTFGLRRGVLLTLYARADLWEELRKTWSTGK